MSASTRLPGHLSAPIRRWAAKVLEAYELEDHHVRVLIAAAEAWDRKEEARKLIDSEGIVTLDRFGQSRTHPAVAVERDARVAFLRALRELDLDAEAGPDPRVPRR